MWAGIKKRSKLLILEIFVKGNVDHDILNICAWSERCENVEYRDVAGKD